MSLKRDLVVGAALSALAIGMLAEAQGFPRIRAMPYGPDLFPRIIATGLLLAALGIVIEGLRTARAAQRITSADTTPAHRVPGSLRLAAFAFGVIAALVAGFALLLPILGFHIAAGLVVLLAVPVFGGNPVLAVIMALSVPVVLHYVFYSLMRVVLPWGLLTPIAW
ncbi:MAG: tripartite tricarboxylate transporter TctB family protein [Roseinatronobacter sp.]